MSVKNFGRMSVAELVKEGEDIRRNLASSALQLGEVYRALYAKVRRQPSDDTTSTYMMVANMGQRLAGMVVQGIKRSSSFDRIIASLPTEEEKEQARLDAEKEARVKLEEEKLLKELNFRSTSQDDLYSLYGEDF